MMGFGILPECSELQLPSFRIGTINEVYTTLNGFDLTRTASKRVEQYTRDCAPPHIRLLGYNNYQGPPPPPAIMPSSSQAVSTTSIAFCAEGIGYFDPHLDEAYGKGDIVQMGKEVYYCDVHLFL